MYMAPSGPNWMSKGRSSPSPCSPLRRGRAGAAVPDERRYVARRWVHAHDLRTGRLLAAQRVRRRREVAPLGDKHLARHVPPRRGRNIDHRRGRVELVTPENDVRRRRRESAGRVVDQEAEVFADKLAVYEDGRLQRVRRLKPSPPSAVRARLRKSGTPYQVPS